MALASAAILALSQIAPGTAAAVCGFPGSGKTRDTQLAAPNWPRCIVYDPYAARDRINAARDPSHECHPWPGELCSVADLAREPHRLFKTNLRLVVYPTAWRTKVGGPLRDPLDPEALGAQFETLARMAWAVGGGIVIVGEESGLYSRASAELGLRIATGGRHGGLAMVALAQSIGRLHIDYRRCLRLLCTGCQTEPIDVEAMRERCGEDFARRVSSMPHGAPLLVWEAGTAPTPPADIRPPKKPRAVGRRPKGRKP